MDEPMLLLLLGGALVFVLAVLLWKVLLTTAGIAGAQWAVLTGFPDDPIVQVIAYGLPALLAAVALVALPRLVAAAVGRPHVRSVHRSHRRAHDLGRGVPRHRQEVFA